MVSAPSTRFRGTLVPALSLLLLLALGSFPRSPEAASRLPGFSYVSPRPGAELVSPRNNIVLRPGAELGIEGLEVVVRGSASGLHAGSRVESDHGGGTLIFNPATPFTPGETVTISVRRGGAELERYAFTVARVDPSTVAPRNPRDLLDLPEDGARPGMLAPDGPAAAPGAITGCDSLPDLYPPLEVTVANYAEPGYVFFAPFTLPITGGHLVMLDQRGEPLFYRTQQGFTLDFKLQPNGLLTFFEASKYYSMDSTYTVVDSFATGNGYVTDLHGIQLLPSGNALLMSYDPQPVRMDSVVAGGDSSAVVTGLIIQEIDPAKNVVFQWRSWDYFSIFDGDVSDYVDLTRADIDYVHGNSMELDLDGNIIISSRHMNEITKIDRTTGDIIWRFGGNALNNDFTIIGDPRGFSHQHDARRLPNGNITLFDNGNFLVPEYSRALEYDMDENAMTATLVWEFDADMDIYGAFMGNAQRHADGGTTIGWGGAGARKLSDVRADGSIAFEVNMPATMFTYRAFRFPWRTTRFTTGADTLNFGTVTVGGSADLSLTIHNPAATPLEIDCFHSRDTTFVVVDSLPLTIPANDSVSVTLRYSPLHGFGSASTLYLRSVTSTEVVSQWVRVLGNGGNPTGIGEPRVEMERPRLLGNHPNPFRPATAISFQLPQEELITLRVFDINGRLVRSLARDRFPAGTHSLTWDGRDEAGRSVGGGVYFYRLTAAGMSETRRLVRLK